MDATSPPPTIIAMDTTEAGGPINSLPEDLLRNIFEKFNSSWGPWVPWAPVGWSPPPPLTPKHLSVPNGGAQQDPERMELEAFNALRQNLCLVSKCASHLPRLSYANMRRPGPTVGTVAVFRLTEFS